MKKVYILLIVCSLLISGAGVLSTSSDKIKITISTVSFSEPLIKIENDFTIVSFIEANSYLIEEGKPILPTYTKIYSFPLKTNIINVECTLNNFKTIKITNKIKLSPEPQILGQITQINQKESINNEVGSYPLNWYTYDVRCGLYNGELSTIVKLVIKPIKYYSQEKIIECFKEAKIVIQYEEPKEEPTKSEQYKLVIIAPDEYSDELAPLITHKTNKGITTKFVGLNEIYDGSGYDNQEDIKYYIRDAIEEFGTSYVLLVGSNTKLPGRTTHVRYENEDAELFVSDLYFADIYDSNGDFCSWDSNGNGLYGEYNWSTNHDYDDVDLIPDVYLGRLPCRSGTEVTNVVNKIINYENNQAYLQNWFKNLVVVGGDSFPHDDTEGYDVDEGEFNNQIVIDMMTNFTSIKLWVTNGVLTGWSPTGVSAIQNAINDGCGFVDFCGHGNTNIWATHPHLEFSTWVPTPTGGILSSQISTLTNGDKLPIITVEACSTAKFASDENCFNWAFIYNKNGGAIGAYGATGLGWSYTGNFTDQGLIGKMGLDTYRAYIVDGSIYLGEMWGKALNRYMTELTEFHALDYKTIEEWELFGDPTLQIAKEPGAPLKPAKPTGPTTGIPDTVYTYSTSTTDPENDEIYYIFDWGDGTNSGWIGPYTSGTTVEANHSWNSKNTYLIKVQANNTYGKVSEWSDPLSISIPHSKTIFYNSLSKLILNLYNKSPILQKILKGL